MVEKRLNKVKLIGVVAVFLIIIVSIIVIFAIKKKHASLEYKLEVIGYSESEVEYIKSSFDSSEISHILSIEYSNKLLSLSKEKYFRFDRLDDYLEYSEKESSLTAAQIITKINTHTDLGFYEKIYDTDTSKKELMMVNKYYKLSETYEPEDLIEVPIRYAYSGKYVSESILENLESMLEAAREVNYKLVVSQGYRSYKDQASMYESYESSNGEEAADAFVSRPGHSDYQTGLSFDLQPYNKVVENPETNEEHIWLVSNAHKYGFIFRYPDGVSEVTGFKYYPWRLRYVGVDAATYIYNNNITFEEYYGYNF